jgi:TetR/AcrR family transcriptional regulator, repressor of fatR-cypB operon
MTEGAEREVKPRLKGRARLVRDCRFLLDRSEDRMNIHSMPAAEHDKSDAILRAALDLFVERGFHGTSVPSVADKAGVATGTIYHYFANKEALVNALFRNLKQRIVDQVITDFPFAAPMREQFRTAWGRMAAFAVKNPREFAFLELHHHSSYLDAESKALENQIIELALGLVRTAQEAQLLKPLPPALLTEFANGAFIGVFRAGMAGLLPLTVETFLAAEPCGWEAIRA